MAMRGRSNDVAVPTVAVAGFSLVVLLLVVLLAVACTVWSCSPKSCSCRLLNVVGDTVRYCTHATTDATSTITSTIVNHNGKHTRAGTSNAADTAAHRWLLANADARARRRAASSTAALVVGVLSVVVMNWSAWDRGRGRNNVTEVQNGTF